VAIRADRTDNRCPLGSLAGRCGWRKWRLPCRPQPDTRNGSLHRVKARVSPAITLCPGPSCAVTGSRSRSGRRGAVAGPGGAAVG
jgi:hypothetical protein